LTISDWAVIFPGGAGTIDEYFSVLRLGIPVALVNSVFWDSLLKVVNASLTQWGFEPLEYFIADNEKRALDYLAKQPARTTAIEVQTSKQAKRIKEEFETAYIKINHLDAAITILGTPKTKDSIELQVAKDLAIRAWRRGISIRVVNEDVFNGISPHIGKMRMQALLHRPSQEIQDKNPNVVAYKSLIIESPLITNNTDAYVFLPGGIDTLDQLSDVIVGIKLGHVEERPMVLIGKKFWLPILEQLKQIMGERADGLELAPAVLWQTLSENTVDTAEEAAHLLGLRQPAMQCLLARYRRMAPDHAQELDAKGTEQLVKEGVAVAFGIKNLSDVERHAGAMRVLSEIDRLEFDGHIREEILYTVANLSPFVSWHNTGVHRFSPIALAINNLLRGRGNLLAPAGVPELLDIEIEHVGKPYLRDLYALFANPFHVPESSYFPHIHVMGFDIHKSHLACLDIGSAPGIDGSACINFLADVFISIPSAHPNGRTVRLDGNDIIFPAFQIDDEGRVTRSPFLDMQQQPDYRGVMNFQNLCLDITYLDASYDAKYNVMHSEFLTGEADRGPYDIIILAMMLHSISEEEEVIEERSIDQAGEEEITWEDDEGNPIDTPRYLLTEVQLGTIERLMGKLAEGGLFFLNLPWGADYFEDGNWHFFLVIQCMDINRFRIYRDAIPFRPNITYFESAPYLLKGFSEEFTHDLYSNEGIVSLYENLDPKDYDLLFGASDREGRIEHLLRIADKLAYQYQSKNHSVWNRLFDAVQAIHDKESLSHIFGAYLADVSNKDPIKQNIMREVREIEDKM